MALWIRIFFPLFFHFLSFWMGRKKDHFSIFSVSFSFFGNEWEQELRMRENWKVLLFIPTFISFCFFSSVFSPFSLFFSLFFRVWEWGWEWREEEFFLFFFSFYFLFLGKQRGINWKKSKEILSIFLINFLSFFFLKTLLPFSFWERNWKIGTIKMCAPIALKRFCKNTCCLSTPRIFILGQNCLAFAKHKTA